MENSLVPAVADKRCIRLLQLTDMHLFHTRYETLLGVNTWDSYQAVLAAVATERQPIDLIVATGDLAQDQSSAAYQAFAEGIQQLSAPCVWLPGNHDFQPAMVSALASHNLCTQKVILLGDAWQLVLLDSQVYGVPHGQISDDQLTWLAEVLAAAPDRYSVVALHHHPTPSGCSWLDTHSLRNADQLAKVLAEFPRASTLLCGHIHQELDLLWQGVRLLSTPSTCLQFRPHCTHFTIDHLSPGWRWLELLPDGKLHTQVKRLAGAQFIPDRHAEGY